ncbi:MAG: DUF2314 domain-containing protein [Mucilaginibacter sp.]|uniref:DUF2314 domain-containing protein n=1 Tax=Mucilaginibacter sp. TaxID=1882438 RepID=UPI003264C377
MYQSVNLKSGDKVFLALKDTAQKHLQEFINQVKKFGRDADHYQLVVKSDFAEKGEHEHMWSQVYSYGSGTFKAIFIDSPFKLKNIKTGQQLTINQKDIEDWAVYNTKGQLLAGSFSAKYLDGKKE